MCKHFLRGKKKTSTLTRADIDQFSLFLQQLARRMSAHIRYEIDLIATVDPADELLIPFDIASYVAEIHQYFFEHRLYEHVTEKEFHSILLEILAPAAAARESLPTDRRKRIFAGTLKNVSAQSGISLNSLVKFYHEYISILEGPVNGISPEELLDIFLASVKFVVENDPALVQREEAARQRKWALLDAVFSAFRIRGRRQLERVLNRGRMFGALLFIIASALLFVAAETALKSSSIQTAIMSILKTLLQKSEQISLLAILFVLVIVCFLVVLLAAIRFIFDWSKRRRLVRCFNGVAGAAEISAEDAREYLKLRFNADYRRFF